MKNKNKNFPIKKIAISNITISEDFRILGDLVRFLDQYKLDGNDRISGLKYREACTSCHLTKPVFCEMLEFLQERGYLTYIPISEDIFDVIVKGALKKS